MQRNYILLTLSYLTSSTKNMSLSVLLIYIKHAFFYFFILVRYNVVIKRRHFNKNTSFSRL